MPPPLLPSLTRAEAAALERILGAGLIHLLHARTNARALLAKARAGTAGRNWRRAHEAELADATRLIAAARRFEQAAHDRALTAAREEAAAIRAIEALARTIAPRTVEVAT